MDFNNFLFNKPLRWIFGQLFGHKAKSVYDTKIEPLVISLIDTGKLPNSAAITQYLNSDAIDGYVTIVLAELKLKGSEAFLIKYLLLSYIKATVTKIIPIP